MLLSNEEVRRLVRNSDLNQKAETDAYSHLMTVPTQATAAV